MEHIENIIAKQRVFFKSNQTRPWKFRIENLERLRKAIVLYQSQIEEALYLDLGKSFYESYLTEIGIVLHEIRLHKKHLKKWMKEKKVGTPLQLQTGKSKIMTEPYGNVLIMAPWNYPFHLVIMPLIGAISAGNTAILKPSEHAVHTSKLLKKMIDEIFPQEYICVVEGAVKENQFLLENQFDMIFFTGSTNVGKIVMKAASTHLTPVVLELGGKSPAIVLYDADLELAAKRIVFGKFLNLGQTCVAPDYVLVSIAEKEEFIQYCIDAIRTTFGTQPLLHDLYGKIINQNHLERLLRLLEDQNIIYGGKYDDTRLEPTLVDDAKNDSLLMQEEIFGPILPIITYDGVEEAIDFVNNKDKPLALYVFGEDKKTIERVLQRTSFGGGSVNDTIMHLASANLPFGGVGASGMGMYHGKASFDAFSHKKGIYYKTKGLDPSLRYFPVTSLKTKILYKFLK